MSWCADIEFWVTQGFCSATAGTNFDGTRSVPPITPSHTHKTLNPVPNLVKTSPSDPPVLQVAFEIIQTMIISMGFLNLQVGGHHRLAMPPAPNRSPTFVTLDCPCMEVTLSLPLQALGYIESDGKQGTAAKFSTAWIGGGSGTCPMTARSAQRPAAEVAAAAACFFLLLLLLLLLCWLLNLPRLLLPAVAAAAAAWRPGLTHVRSRCLRLLFAPLLDRLDVVELSADVMFAAQNYFGLKEVLPHDTHTHAHTNHHHPGAVGGADGDGDGDGDAAAAAAAAAASAAAAGDGDDADADADDADDDDAHAPQDELVKCHTTDGSQFLADAEPESYNLICIDAADHDVNAAFPPQTHTHFICICDAASDLPPLLPLLLPLRPSNADTTGVVQANDEGPDMEAPPGCLCSSVRPPAPRRATAPIPLASSHLFAHLGNSLVCSL